LREISDKGYGMMVTSERDRLFREYITRDRFCRKYPMLGISD